ncbi:SwmB domain-containing protein [Paenibacillus sp. SN-8-1]|uniref:SwmB domain-containing protein n=1 Tax=Paenibacillus sp. SN-8-1 TaxID=3435409 RepID=UPI003D9A7CAE
MRTKIALWLVLVMGLNMVVSVAAAAAAVQPDPTLIPTVTTPVNGSKGIDPTKVDLKVQFDRKVKAGTGTITVTKDPDSTPSVAGTIAVAPSVVDAYSTIRNIDTSGITYAPGSNYLVSLSEGTFVDEAGNNSAAFSYRFKTLTAGSVPPSASTFAPLNNAIVSSTSQTLSVTFSKPVMKGKSGNITVKRASDNTSILSLPVASTQIAITGANMDTATFAVSGLTAGERYYVLIDPGAFVDDDDQSYTGITSAQDWVFNVRGTAVQLNSVSPANLAANVTPGGSLKLTFSRPVYPVQGAISIKPSGLAAQSVPLTSSSVTGGGTNTITVVPQTALTPGTSYTVTVPVGAFTDSDNNSYPSSTAYSWTFTTGSVVSTQLAVTSKNPSDQSSAASTSVIPTLTFNRSIKLQGSVSSLENGQGNLITLRKAGTTSIPSALIQTSGSQLIISPRSVLDAGATYYVDIAAGAILDSATNASFAGFTGTSSWSFSTGVLDKTAPLLQSAQLYNNSTIRLQYNKTLDSSVNLLTSSFQVTVNDESRRISSAYVSGDAVYVALETGVAVGQNIRISYTGNTVRPIQDLYKNAASAFSLREVANGIDSALPKPQDGYVSGSTVVLTFRDSLKSVSSYAAGQFSVTSDGYSKGISSISQSGSYVYLYLSSSVGDGEVVKVSYSPGSYPLQDYRGQNISGFSDFYVRNTYDTKPPVFTRAEGSGNTVVLTYNEALKPSGIPMKSQYSVLVNNSPIYVTAVVVSSNQVTLTLASSYTAAQTVTVSYVPASGGISDLNGNLAGYLNLEPVNYSSTAGQNIRSATVNGDTVTVVYNSTLSYSSASLPANSFYVTADNQQKGVQSASLSGSTITLKLSTPVTSGQTADLSYMQGSPLLYDSQGKAVPAFSRMALQNLTEGATSNNGLPSYLTLLQSGEFGRAAYVLNLSTASKVNDRSRAGQDINKYTLDKSKLSDAYNFVATAGLDRALAFEVPSTEKAAKVVIPLQALMEAYTRGGNPSFIVRYGDVLYEIPLAKISFTDLSRLVGGTSFTSTNLVVQLERISRSTLTGQTTSTGAGVSYTAVEDPFETYVSLVSSNSSSAQPVDITGKLIIRTSKSAPSSQTAMIKFDANTRTGSFLPSKVTKLGSYSALTAQIPSNIIAGPATGITFFSDVSSHWASTDINELASKLIIDGRTQNQFQPNQNITRSEFAVYIAKGLGLSPDNSSGSRFRDVSSLSPSAAYINAAAKAGIITGNTDGTFQPGSPITREQMAIMMVRALSTAGYNVTLGTTPAQTLRGFKDSKKISYQDFVAKAYQEGIIQGTSTTTFDPKGNATRAQAAVMLKRVLTKLGYL